ncbi:MAG TPA: acyl-CoA dehydrogenase family protein, partial [Longimicrobiales bacterium]|nr:acyl-CoA dehydrogenase family protein [Longimicrobiales bacterium]
MADDRRRDLATEQESRAVAEAAREEEWEGNSFARSLFDGRLRMDLIYPPPEGDPEEEARAAEFLEKLEAFARDHIDGDRIDQEGHVPEEVLDGLRELGAFGIKIPREYGGLGLSQVSYGRALAIVGSVCGATSAFLSAHQSIGVPQPLTLFGTEEQKRKYLPRLAKGALSAFALTEPDVGSDPANLSTTAIPTEDGRHYVLNGEKLWTTNGPRAELMVVMARTPAPEGAKRKPITAFIVEADWEGVDTAHECSFMGIRGISNGVIRFEDVKVPAENVLWGEGKGLKLALITLNTGRLSLPAICAAGGKVSTQISRRWARERHQWGATIGKHDAIAQKIGRMAADTFAMEAVVELAGRMADSGEFDIRLEAAMAKLWHSETAWRISDDMVQIRGGRGYETAPSLADRGEAAIPAERILRDMRINRIFEGSSEIMHLFIAREAVDRHLEVAGDMVDPRAPLSQRIGSALKAGVYYAWWYPTRWIGWSFWPRYSEFGPLAGHVRWVHRTSRRLARNLFHAMVRFGAG